ncbi:hypothetical protein H0E87_031677, partial [Populus deltoides]
RGTRHLGQEAASNDNGHVKRAGAHHHGGHWMRWQVECMTQLCNMARPWAAAQPELRDQDILRTSSATSQRTT